MPDAVEWSKVRAAAVEGERLLWAAAAAAVAAAVAAAAAAAVVPGLTSFTETGTVRNMLFLEYTRCKKWKKWLVRCSMEVT